MSDYKKPPRDIIRATDGRCCTIGCPNNSPSARPVPRVSIRTRNGRAPMLHSFAMICEACAGAALAMFKTCSENERQTP